MKSSAHNSPLDNIIRFIGPMKFKLFVCFLILVVVIYTLKLYLGDTCTYWKENTNHETDKWWKIGCALENDWETMEYTCDDTRLMGNYPICFDDPYNPLKQGKPCIVYSFGIANDFRFDDAMAKRNCTVYSFDPSMHVDDHLRGKLVHFKNMGLSDFDDDNFRPRPDGYATSSDVWKMRKLSTIMKELGHSAESITLLKMDIENSEWGVLSTMLSEDILSKLPQVVIEFHIFPDSPSHDRFSKMSDDYYKMKSLGFKKFWMRNEGRNHNYFKFNTQAETAWINSHHVLPNIPQKK